MVIDKSTCQSLASFRLKIGCRKYRVAVARKFLGCRYANLRANRNLGHNVIGYLISHSLANAPVVAVNTYIFRFVYAGIFKHLCVRTIVEVLESRGTHELSVEQGKVV